MSDNNKPDDRVFIAGAKSVSYLIIFVALIAVLFRGVVGPLWGSQSDFGMVGAPLALIGGIFGLGWLARKMRSDVSNTLNRD